MLAHTNIPFLGSCMNDTVSKLYCHCLQSQSVMWLHVWQEHTDKAQAKSSAGRHSAFVSELVLLKLLAGGMGVGRGGGGFCRVCCVLLICLQATAPDPKQSVVATNESLSGTGLTASEAADFSQMRYGEHMCFMCVLRITVYTCSSISWMRNGADNIYTMCAITDTY